MPNIPCEVHIEQFTPVDVFDAGTLKRNLPSTVPNFRLNLPGKRIVAGSELSMDVNLLGQHTLEAEVTKYEEATLVRIEGSHKLLGDAALQLMLEEHESGGTLVKYALDVDFGPIVPSFSGPLVTRKLKGIVSEYAGVYTDNVVTDLSSRDASRRKAA